MLHRWSRLSGKRPPGCSRAPARPSGAWPCWIRREPYPLCTQRGLYCVRNRPVPSTMAQRRMGFEVINARKRTTNARHQFFERSPSAPPAEPIPTNAFPSLRLTQVAITWGVAKDDRAETHHRHSNIPAGTAGFCPCWYPPACARLTSPDVEWSGLGDFIMTGGCNVWTRGTTNCVCSTFAAMDGTAGACCWELPQPSPPWVCFRGGGFPFQTYKYSDHPNPLIGLFSRAGG